MAKAPTNASTNAVDAPLRKGGPTLEEFTEAGYKASQYPPKGYEEVDSPALRALKESGLPRDEAAITHIAVRSRGGRFRRAGLHFTSDWQTFPVADLTADQLARVRAEPALDVRDLKDGETTGFNAGALPGDDESVSKAELRQALAESNARAERLDTELTALKAKISGADLPPKSGEPAPGQYVSGSTSVATLGTGGPPVSNNGPANVPPAK